MNKLTAKCLRSSIFKWERVSEGVNIKPNPTENDGDTCALCHRFADRFPTTMEKAPEYEQCPVAMAVGGGERCNNCRHTPYTAYAFHSKHPALAAAEAAFLNHLLPESEKGGDIFSPNELRQMVKTAKEKECNDY